MPENVVVELSKESSPFLPMASLNYEQTLAYEDSLTFYVRVTAKKDAVPGDGEFDINVEGDPVK